MIPYIDECIPARGEPDGNGYGQAFHNGKVVKAHRLALAKHEGIEVPSSDVHCLHSCDNPICVNPAHLRWGTAKDNALDMIKRNRQPASKLTWDLRKEIHYATGTLRELAAQYGVTSRVIWRIKHVQY